MENITPVEMLMLNYVREGIKSNMDFPNYWHYQYGADAKQVVVNLLNKGLLQLGDVDISLQHMETKDLKEILKKAGLKVSGKKVDLVERIINEIDKQSLLALGLPVYIIRSEMGDRILSEGYQDGMKEYYEAKIIYGDREAVLPILELIANKKFKEAEKYIENPQKYDEKVFSEYVDFHIETLEPYQDYELRMKACTIYATMAGKSNIARKILDAVCDINIPTEVFEKVRKYLIAMKDYLLMKETGRGLSREISGCRYVYTIRSMGDERCCGFCKMMEGHTFEVSEAMFGINYPPFQKCTCSYCRCFVSVKSEKH